MSDTLERYFVFISEFCKACHLMFVSDHTPFRVRAGSAKGDQRAIVERDACECRLRLRRIRSEW